jgi:hypothetical protein
MLWPGLHIKDTGCFYAQLTLIEILPVNNKKATNQTNQYEKTKPKPK